jgi:NADH-quinone oxidoreductase subunit G
MCDVGRFAYKAINAPTRLLHPQIRQGDALVQTGWPEAVQHAVTAMREHGGAAVGLLVAPQGTNEDCYALARLAREVLGTAHVVLSPGEPGVADELLLQADRNPNTRGAQDVGLPAAATAERLDALAGAIEQGTVRVLYAVDTDLEAAFGAEKAARLAARLQCLILQTAHTRPGCAQAHVVLPAATYAERDGTFTNFQGRIQRINAAIARQGEALPGWQIATRLAQGLGQDWSYSSAETVLADIAVAVPQYQGLSYAKIGDQGLATEG